MAAWGKTLTWVDKLDSFWNFSCHVWVGGECGGTAYNRLKQIISLHESSTVFGDFGDLVFQFYSMVFSNFA